MRMAVMNVGIVRMRMSEPVVAMIMRVRRLVVPREIVFVMMVFVVRMFVGVQRRFVRVTMAVSLRHVQPNAGDHQRRGDPERRIRHIGEQDER